MNVLIISGSPLTGDSVTFRLAERLVRRLFPQAQCRVAHLAQLALPPCNGRLDSIKDGAEGTAQFAALMPLYNDMHWADVLVIASPVHNFTVSALIKNFIDLMVFESHRPSFMGRAVIPVATAMGAGQTRVLDYLQEVAHSWGFRVVGRLGADSSVLHEPWYEARLVATLERLDTRVRAALAETLPRVSLRDLIAFRIWRLVVDYNRERTPVDYRYWTERQWLTADYYFPCRTSAPARWLSALVAALARRTIVGRRMKPVT